MGFCDFQIEGLEGCIPYSVIFAPKGSLFVLGATALENVDADPVQKKLKPILAIIGGRSFFFNRPRYRFVESGYRQGEDVYAASGQTDAGQYLIVFFIHKSINAALIVSARDMDKKERNRYERE